MPTNTPMQARHAALKIQDHMDHDTVVPWKQLIGKAQLRGEQALQPWKQLNGTHTWTCHRFCSVVWTSDCEIDRLIAWRQLIPPEVWKQLMRPHDTKARD